MQSYTWFYSLGTALSEAEEVQLQADFNAFTEQWKSHGTPVDGLIQIRHQQFVIIQSNPADARPSGCSIDSLKRGVSDILVQRGHEVVDASQVFYRNKEGAVELVDFRQVKEKVSAGDLTANSIVFDHSLSQSDDLNKWEVAMKDTWLNRYL